MKIKVYPITSVLSSGTAKAVIEARGELLSRLHDLTNNEFVIVDSVSELNKDDGSLSLIFIQSGGSEGNFLKIYNRLKEPYYLLTLGSNNSLAASMEILTYLKAHDKKGEILHGDVNYIAQRIRDIVNLEYQPDKLGVVGRPSDWLIASHELNQETLLNKFNIELVNIDINEVINDALSRNDDINEDMFKATFNHEELKRAYYVYKALVNVINKYNLKGITIRCFDLISSKLKTTACLALSLLNDEGIIGCCEGDLPALVSMFMVRKVLHKPSFQANPSKIDVPNSEMIVAHCTLPTKMTTSYKFMTHYESDLGVGIKGELEKKKIRLFRIGSNLDKFVFLDANIEGNLNLPNLCRTQIKVHVNGDILYFLKRPLGNHHIIFYSDKTDDELRETLLDLGLEEVK